MACWQITIRTPDLTGREFRLLMARLVIVLRERPDLSITFRRS